jgi:hypothetical protein
MGTGGPFLGCKPRPGRDADHLPPIVPRSRMIRSYTSSPPKHLHGVWWNCLPLCTTFACLCPETRRRNFKWLSREWVPVRVVPVARKLSTLGEGAGTKVVYFSEEITGTKTKRVGVSWFLFPLKIVSVAQILRRSDREYEIFWRLSQLPLGTTTTKETEKWHNRPSLCFCGRQSFCFAPGLF